MKKIIYTLFLVCITIKVNAQKTLLFSNLEWIIKDSNENQVGPGGNIFTNNNNHVFVDSEGKLHLTLKERNGTIYATEIVSKKNMSYGSYTFLVTANFVENFDLREVFSGFLYKDDTNEIDIEFSRWNNKSKAQLGTYTNQPVTYNNQSYKFSIPENTNKLTCKIIWKRNKIIFETYNGHFVEKQPKKTLVAKYVYRNKKRIPIDNNMKFRFNLWAFSNIKKDYVLKNNNPIEVIVDKFIIE